jgi:hypothetical protein
LLHALEVSEIAADGDHAQTRHTRRGLADDRRPSEATRCVAQAHRRHEGQALSAQLGSMPKDGERQSRVDAREAVDDVGERRVDELAQFLGAARGVGEGPGADRFEVIAYVLQLVDALGPLEPRRHGLAPEVVGTKRKPDQRAQASEAQSEIVGYVGVTPLPVNDLTPVTGVAEGDRHRGERRVLGQRRRL